ncbi:signal peptidase I [Solirubrobacter sp. CPCC 204708]|uniref:Signal peptidase I n=1 Tax=Solirubrobacter deserti TaxID=2282478 RepID=A0ABT4RGQ9_9ACTN|nr:signal peptidase I [Solirubrobacter deserti]MBE2319593.1 signal peptidase I [Solirubrobacter deserti]MDA0137668.1 signal peptidase I [Solirubrobacter deserti]
MLEFAVAIALALPSAQTPDRELVPVPAENMVPRLNINQRLEFDLAAYRERPPRVGDIVLLHPPTGAREERCGQPRNRAPEQLCAKPRGGADTERRFIMRVVATAGDRVTFRRGLVVRNGKLERRKVRRCTAGCPSRGIVTVPAGHVYVAGDNRPNSDDSRFWGALPVDQLLGRYVRTCKEFAEDPSPTCTSP